MNFEASGLSSWWSKYGQIDFKSSLVRIIEVLMSRPIVFRPGPLCLTFDMGWGWGVIYIKLLKFLFSIGDLLVDSRVILVGKGMVAVHLTTIYESR